jgi:uncharacterized membrane protein
VSWVHFFLGGVCHQLPERSFQFGGRALPLCARCTGTFLGALLAFVALYIIARGRRGRFPIWQVNVILAGLMAWWAVDGSNSFLYLITGHAWLYMPSNTLRLITGMGCGLTIGAVIHPLYQASVWRGAVNRPVLENVGQLGLLLAVGAAGVLLVLGWRTAPYEFWTALLFVAVLGVFTLLNSILVVILFRKEGLVVRYAELVPYTLIGLVMSVAEIGSLATLHYLLLG